MYYEKDGEPISDELQESIDLFDEFTKTPEGIRTMAEADSLEAYWQCSFAVEVYPWMIAEDAALWMENQITKFEESRR